MSRFRRLGALWLCTVLAGVAGAPSRGEEAGTAPGSLEFEGSNLMTTADGVFHRWHFSRLEVDRENPAASFVEVEVDVASLDTGIDRRDDHLRSDDFFDTEKFPKALVRVHSAARDGESEGGHPRYRAKFDIRIRDVERTLDGTFDVVSTTPPEVRGELVLNRAAFGVGKPHSRWNPMSVGNDILVRFSARLPLE